MGLNDRGNDNQTFGSTWTVETNVSSNPEELSSRGIGLHGKLYKNVSYEFIGIDNVNIRLNLQNLSRLRIISYLS